jgi:DNA-binding NtrC family response regulator
VANEIETKQWSSDGLDALIEHSWPGNVRELAALIDRLAILTPDSTIRGSDVRAALPGAPKYAGSEIPQEGSLYALLEAVERRIIEDRIARFDGNMTAAARDLGLERSHLYKKVKRLGIARS